MAYKSVSLSFVFIAILFVLTNIELRAQANFTELNPENLPTSALGADRVGQSVVIKDEESGVEIVLKEVPTNSLSCDNGEMFALEDFENTNIGSNNVVPCLRPLNTLTNDLCYSTGAVISGFSLTTFNDPGQQYAVVVPPFLGVTNVAVGPNSIAADTRISFDVPTDQFELRIFDASGPGGLVKIELFDEKGDMLLDFNIFLNGPDIPTTLKGSSLAGGLARIDITDDIDDFGDTRELIYDLGFCKPVIPQVPTLSAWGIIALAGTLGITGFFILIRRKKLTA